MRWRLIAVAALLCAASVAIAFWALYAPQFGHWLQVHTGTINESGPYYGFWSGFGSDLEEFGVLGAIGAGIYQLIKVQLSRAGLLADRAVSGGGRPVPALLSPPSRLPGQEAKS